MRIFTIKTMVYVLSALIAISVTSADAAVKKKRARAKSKRASQTVQPFTIAYSSPEAAYKAMKSRTDVTTKPNAKPFGWQDRSGPWYVANEKPNIEWAFTESGHYAHPSVIKRMIDVGSTDHVYVDMAFRCGAANTVDCDKLLNEFKEVSVLIKKVYQKKYITTSDGTPAWSGPDSLE